MNMATIRRNSGRSRGGLSGNAARRPAKREGLTTRVAQALQLDEHRLHKLMTWMLGLILAGMAWLVAVFLGVPAMLWSETSDLAKRSGLQVAKVEVHGTQHMDELPVYNQALTQIDRSMLDLDLAGLRAQIMTLGWVEDARVSRRLPDTLVVNIIERRPVAIWQHERRLNLVDGKGVVLDGVDPRTMSNLPLVVGPNANHQTAALGKLMEAAPALKPMLAGASWVGNRRWDLKFNSGETLALPEGEAEAAAALVNFARMDGVDRLLGRGIIRFDMRDPARFVLRLPPGRTGNDGGAVPALPSDLGAPVVDQQEGAAESGPTSAASSGGQG